VHRTNQPLLSRRYTFAWALKNEKEGSGWVYASKTLAAKKKWMQDLNNAILSAKEKAGKCARFHPPPPPPIHMSLHCTEVVLSAPVSPAFPFTSCHHHSHPDHLEHCRHHHHHHNHRHNHGCCVWDCPVRAPHPHPTHPTTTRAHSRAHPPTHTRSLRQALRLRQWSGIQRLRDQRLQSRPSLGVPAEAVWRVRSQLCLLLRHRRLRLLPRSPKHRT
jgi:hypothetical protein